MNYYSGGLAELVSEPSRLTYSFLSNWFKGSGSLGEACRLLGLPYEGIEDSVLTVDGEGKLRVDLDIEERTMYHKTIFRYRQRKDVSGEPMMYVSFKKAVNMGNWPDSWKILKNQIMWLSRGNVLVSEVESWLSQISDPGSGLSWQEYDEKLNSLVWPRVIAGGMVCEYYYQVVKKSYKTNDPIWSEIDEHIAVDDWFFRSLSDQREVAGSRMSFEEYIDKYGDRADSDYELACPRWREILKTVKTRIADNKFVQKSGYMSKIENNQVMNYVRLQKCRADLRRICLEYIYLLRKGIIKAAGSEKIAGLTRDELNSGEFSEKKETVRMVRKPVGGTIELGLGRPVSKGITSGKIIHVNKDNTDKVSYEGMIGVFPNASTEFTQCYPKCSGIIFLAGGQTSHGAIVAREFGVPAIIDSTAIGAREGMVVTVNGDTGEWKKS